MTDTYSTLIHCLYFSWSAFPSQVIILGNHYLSLSSSKSCIGVFFLNQFKSVVCHFLETKQGCLRKLAIVSQLWLSMKAIWPDFNFLINKIFLHITCIFTNPQIMKTHIKSLINVFRWLGFWKRTGMVSNLILKILFQAVTTK